MPKNRTIKEYIHKTGDFQSSIVAVVKEKNGQCTVWFRSEGTIKIVSVKLIHECKLKLEIKKTKCRNFEPSEEENRISNIIYSKTVLEQANE
ncbi:MAG: hypothetical protein NWE95_06820 [Candidatus Bathyarchaeota archaeon]|nr:hypothetical protein [Candidatus Bathyarchaeota archaeon]